MVFKIQGWREWDKVEDFKDNVVKIQGRRDKVEVNETRLKR